MVKPDCARVNAIRLKIALKGLLVTRSHLFHLPLVQGVLAYASPSLATVATTLMPACQLGALALMEIGRGTFVQRCVGMLQTAQLTIDAPPIQYSVASSAYRITNFFTPMLAFSSSS